MTVLTKTSYKIIICTTKVIVTRKACLYSTAKQEKYKVKFYNNLNIFYLPLKKEEKHI